MHKIFVYGTLRKGSTNDRFLKDANCMLDQCWTFGELHDTGLGYPAFKNHPTLKVYGEVYEITNEQLLLIDELEDFVEGADNNLYERTKKLVYADQGSIEVFVYLGGEHLFQKSQRIESGDWLEYQRSKLP
jgi:gamma-glutamylcyclotransferase (GGCT)/AIG2-like uncharacterized protein YtfP